MSVLLDFVQAENDPERLHEILGTGVDTNERTADGRTALHLVASKTCRNRQDADNAQEMTRLLIIHYATINAKSNLGRTPLIEAVRADNLRMVEYLSRVGAAVNEPDNEGNTPLHHVVVSYNSVDGERNNPRYIRKHIVKALAENNCDLNRLNNDNKTPLMWAVENQDYWIVKELLKQNASVNARDNLNNSLMHYALNQEVVNEDIVLELVRYGCRFFDKNQDDESAMAVYIRNLTSASDDKLKTAEYVFKIFLVLGYMFSDDELRDIHNIGVAEKGKLSHYCQACTNEMDRMSRCRLEEGYTIYRMAKHTITSTNVLQITFKKEVYERILRKLFKGRFPIYCDFIVSAIRRPYLATQFSETCSSVPKADGKFLNPLVLYLVSSYLSHFEMFQIMAALSPPPPVKKKGCLPPFVCGK